MLHSLVSAYDRCGWTSATGGIVLNESVVSATQWSFRVQVLRIPDCIINLINSTYQLHALTDQPVLQYTIAYQIKESEVHI